LKISLNWLKEYVDIEKISTDEIVHRLTMSGLEVEEVIDQNKIYEKFIVGYVEQKEKHPNADRLSLCTVSDGKQSYQVICGAPNVDAGQKVVFAPIGTIIPKGNFEIKKAKLRGIESFGMICAEDELELSDDHSGIMVLDENIPTGASLSEALGLNDVIIEIAITPNRPDALSHLGVARDIAALFDKELKVPSVKLNETGNKIAKLASIEIEDEINCPRYSSKVITDVTIKESPEWLKNRLLSVGLRPINNVVDITNFVMYECGQPLHAFDLDRLAENKIVVKSLKEKTKFTTLDSKERELQKGTLMICDGEKEVAVAGVMGGENSEIDNNTKNILIESAYFNPSSIRKTAKYLQLSTDASYRFERGTDPDNTMYAAERTAQLIAELAGGKIAKGSIDVYPKRIEPLIQSLRISRVNKLLGFNVTKEQVETTLNKLGMDVKEKSADELTVTVPTFRPDIEREVDLIEEIARIVGYDNIPSIPKISITLESKVDETAFTDSMRDTANALGLFEMINNPLQPENEAKLTGRPVKIANPQSMDMAFLRTSLIPGSLNAVKRNLNRGEKNLALFEIGNVFYFNDDKKSVKSFDDYSERQNIIFVLSGKKTDREWYAKVENYDFYDLKGVINSFISKISLDNFLNDSYNKVGNSIFDYYFTKSYNKTLVGTGGKVKNDVLKKFDIDQDVYCFEFDITLLKQIQRGKITYSEPLKFPKSLRDFAFIFDNEVTADSVEKFIKKNGSKILKNIKLFDLFESKDLGGNKKSMAFELEFYDESRTLTEEEIEKDFKKLIKLVTKEFNAQLRGN